MTHRAIIYRFDKFFLFRLIGKCRDKLYFLACRLHAQRASIAARHLATTKMSRTDFTSRASISAKMPLAQHAYPAAGRIVAPILLLT